MPVIALELGRLSRIVGGGVKPETIVETMPYIGLDIESIEDNIVRVEYSPNRPDYSTDYGIGKALRGKLGIEVGAPVYKAETSSVIVDVDPSVEKVRPYVVAAVARGLAMDEEDVRQLISMQEDLHTGLGRRRKAVAIGLHNLDPLTLPIGYTTASPEYRFIPLGQASPKTMAQILELTAPGRQYGHLMAGLSRFPLLLDGGGQVLSFPPIINGLITVVTRGTKDMFVDITGVDLAAMQWCLKIISTTLSDMGGRLGAVEIRYPENVMVTPDLQPSKMELDAKLVRGLLGLKLSEGDIDTCLGRSRLSLAREDGRLIAIIPPYRGDIIHPVDLAEEVMLGYGVDNITPTLPPSTTVGTPNSRYKAMEAGREALVGLGYIELVGFSLVGEEAQYSSVGRRRGRPWRLEAPKSREHEILRDSLLPGLLHSLAGNKSEEYPQKVFELGRVFITTSGGAKGLREETWLAAAIAHKEATFTEARSVAEALLYEAFRKRSRATAASHPLFARGRAASLLIEKQRVGIVGEVKPSVLTSLGLEVPVAAFELNLEGLLRIKS